MLGSVGREDKREIDWYVGVGTVEKEAAKPFSPWHARRGFTPRLNNQTMQVVVRMTDQNQWKLPGLWSVAGITRLLEVVGSVPPFPVSTPSNKLGGGGWQRWIRTKRRRITQRRPASERYFTF